MKARPRGAENRIADELNIWFAKHNLSPIKRIPVLGREGPDFTYNELKLNLDAKSRKAIPKGYKITTPEMLITYNNYICIRLCDLDRYFVEKLISIRHIKSSKTVSKWVKHMGNNAGVILHWPNTPFKNAVLVFPAGLEQHIDEVINGDRTA